jgi:hypothetical protein
LAYKTFLRAIEMATDPSDALVDVKVVGTDSISSSTNLLQAIRSGGWKTRVWWDLKLVCDLVKLVSDYKLTPLSLFTLSARRICLRKSMILRSTRSRQLLQSMLILSVDWSIRNSQLSWIFRHWRSGSETSLYNKLDPYIYIDTLCTT